MRTFFWKLAYTFHMVRLADVPYRLAWQMASDVVADDLHEDFAPIDAVLSELSYWNES